MSPGNREAKDGIEKLKEWCIERAEERAKVKDRSQTVEFYERALKVDPQDKVLVAILQMLKQPEILLLTPHI